MSIDDLLKPRYKVIANWPNSGRSVGEIIIDSPAENQSYIWCNENAHIYPHLFKKMEWWEDRKPEDMPEYVKIKDKIFKVEKWEYDDDTEVENELYAVLDKYYKGAKDWYPRTFDMKPATLEEYRSFINSSQIKG